MILDFLSRPNRIVKVLIREKQEIKVRGHITTETEVGLIRIRAHEPKEVGNL